MQSWPPCPKDDNVPVPPMNLQLLLYNNVLSNFNTKMDKKTFPIQKTPVSRDTQLKTNQKTLKFTIKSLGYEFHQKNRYSKKKKNKYNNKKRRNQESTTTSVIAFSWIIFPASQTKIEITNLDLALTKLRGKLETVNAQLPTLFSFHFHFAPKKSFVGLFCVINLL